MTSYLNNLSRQVTVFKGLHSVPDGDWGYLSTLEASQRVQESILIWLYHSDADLGNKMSDYAS